MTGAGAKGEQFVESELLAQVLTELSEPLLRQGSSWSVTTRVTPHLPTLGLHVFSCPASGAGHGHRQEVSEGLRAGSPKCEQPAVSSAYVGVPGCWERLLMEGLGAGAAQQCPPLSWDPLSRVPAVLPGSKGHPAPRTRHQPGLGEEAFAIPARGRRQKIAAGMELPRGFCFPSAPLTLLPSPPRCRGGRGQEALGMYPCQGGPWASPAWHTAEWWLLRPHPGDHSVEQIPAVQRGPEQCHLHAPPICTAKSSRVHPRPPSSPYEPSQHRVCLVRESNSCLWKRCCPQFPLPLSLPLALIVILA